MSKKADTPAVHEEEHEDISLRAAPGIPTRIVAYGLRNVFADQNVGFPIVSEATIAKRRAKNKVARASRKRNRR